MVWNGLVLNELIHPRGRDSGLTSYLFQGPRRLVAQAYIAVIRLITLECIRLVNNPVYHCRHR